MRLTKLVLTALALSQGAYLLAWSPPERVDRKPDNYVVYLCDIAVSRGGVPHVVWSECPRGTYYEKTMYARKLQDTWSIPINVSRDSGDIRQPAVVLDNSGTPMVVWCEVGKAKFRYVRLVGDTWTTPEFTFTRGGTIPRLVLDVQGEIHLVFDGHNGIWHSHYIRRFDVWTTPDPVALGYFSWQDVTVDRFGHMHAVWMDYDTYGMGYSFYDGTQWSPPEQLPDPAPSGQSCDPKVAADTNGLPHVVWQERYAPGYILFYTKRSGDTWTTPYRFFDQSGGYQSIVADAFDRLHVVWCWSYGVRSVRHTASGWSPPVSVTDSGAFMSRLVESAVGLHLVWRQNWGVRYSEQDLVGVGESWEGAGARPSFCARRAGRSYRLRFSCTRAQDTRLVLADATGRVVRVLVLGRLSRGEHQVELSTDSLVSGVYFCQLRAGTETGTLKLVIGR